MSGLTPVKIADRITLKYQDDFELTGDLYQHQYVDGGPALVLRTAEGDERVSVSLRAAYGLTASPGAVFVPNDYPALAQSLAEAVGGAIGRTVKYGNFNSSATEVVLGDLS